MVTPLTVEKRLDDKGLKKLIEHLISGGVHGVFLLGTNGEAPSLSYELRKELISKACKYIDQRVPVLVGITDSSFEGSIEMAKHAKVSGADVVVVAPPYYFPITDNEMVDYLNTLTPELSLPFMLYNMPSCTKLQLSFETVKKAKQLGAIGIKDSSGDIAYLNGLMEEFSDSSDFVILAGTEAFLPETIAGGGHGAVAGGANLFPRLFVDFYNAVIAKDNDKISQISDKVTVIYDTIYSIGKDASRFTKGIKCALSVKGICDDHMALPLRKFDAGDRALIKGHIEQFEINVAN